MERELTSRFEDLYCKIKAFVDKYGHLPKVNEDKWLYIKIAGEREKIKRGTMPEERVMRLRELGIYSETPEEWEENFKEIERYVHFHNHLPIKGEIDWWERQVWAYKKISINKIGCIKIFCTYRR